MENIKIVYVDDGNIKDAAYIHSVSWRASHGFCPEDFIKLHTPERQEAYLRKKTDGGSKVYMLVAEGEPAGIVSIKDCLIEDLYVLPEKQGNGFGGELLRFAVGKCDGAPTLWILENNSGAERLYRRLGFKRTGRVKSAAGMLDEIEFSL